MLKNILLFVTVISFHALSQNDTYQLIMNVSSETVMVGDDIVYSFYMVNNSDQMISVPTTKSAARGLDDVLTHTFEIFDENGEQINRLFHCGVGGKERRVLSGIGVKPGDTVLLTERTFQPIEAGNYRAKYLFDFHPNDGIKPNPSQAIYKEVLLSKTFEMEVQGLDINVEVTENRISSEELWKAPIVKSISEALKSPDQVFRLHLTNPTIDEINLISKFRNIQDLYLTGGTIESIPEEIYTLYFRSLSISLTVREGIKIPMIIQQSNQLESLALRPVYGVDLSGFEGGDFPKLRTISLTSISEPLELRFLPINTMVALQSFTANRIGNIESLPSDFSVCTKLVHFEAAATDNVNYPVELIIPNVTSLNLYGSSSNTIPNLNKCIKLELLYLANMESDDIPIHLLDIPNLKKIVIRKNTPKNETLKLLKKKGVEIVKS